MRYRMNLKHRVLLMTTYSAGRHAFAAHLLEAGVDLHRIQRLLGHGHITTMMRCFHLAQRHLENTASPLDLLAGTSKTRASAVCGWSWRRSSGNMGRRRLRSGFHGCGHNLDGILKPSASDMALTSAGARMAGQRAPPEREIPRAVGFFTKLHQPQHRRVGVRGNHRRSV
ncbi:MAG: tyrosine-type recombinase/integrase [Gammaproteobacteria bacterium]